MLTIYKVAASTSKGIGAYGTVKQIQTLKAPPSGDVIIVSLISRTNSCLTIGWSPPDKFAASIISYVVSLVLLLCNQVIITLGSKCREWCISRYGRVVGPSADR